MKKFIWCKNTGRRVLAKQVVRSNSSTQLILKV